MIRSLMSTFSKLTGPSPLTCPPASARLIVASGRGTSSILPSVSTAGSSTPASHRAWGMRPVRWVTPMEIDSFYSALPGDGLPPSSVRHIHAVLSSAFNQAQVGPAYRLSGSAPPTLDHQEPDHPVPIRSRRPPHRRGNCRGPEFGMYVRLGNGPVRLDRVRRLFRQLIRRLKAASGPPAQPPAFRRRPPAGRRRPGRDRQRTYVAEISGLIEPCAWPQGSRNADPRLALHGPVNYTPPVVSTARRLSKAPPLDWN